MKILGKLLTVFCAFCLFAMPFASAQSGKVIYQPHHKTTGIHTDGLVTYTIGDAEVYFFIVGSTGVNTAPTSLIECGAGSNVGGPDANGNCYVTTDSMGSFSITDDYECPNDTDDTSPVYYVIKDASVNGGTNNAQFTQLLVSPFTCGYLQANTPSGFVITDFTTVAAAVEAAPFLNTTASREMGLAPSCPIPLTIMQSWRRLPPPTLSYRITAAFMEDRTPPFRSSCMRLAT